MEGGGKERERERDTNRREKVGRDRRERSAWIVSESVGVTEKKSAIVKFN